VCRSDKKYNVQLKVRFVGQNKEEEKCHYLPNVEVVEIDLNMGWGLRNWFWSEARYSWGIWWKID